MVNYIFWPTALLHREKLLDNQQLVAAAVKLEESDYVVLDIQPIDEIHDELTYPYFCVGTRDKTGNWSIDIPDFNVVEFDIPKPNRMQFFSITPISLILPEKETTKCDIYEKLPNLKKLVEYERYKAPNSKLRNSIDIINTYHIHVRAFREANPSFTDFKDEGNGDTQTRPSWYESSTLYKIACVSLYYVMIAVCSISYYGSIALNSTRVPLINISATAKQIDLRLQQICYFPLQFLRIHQAKKLERKTLKFEDSGDKKEGENKELPYTYYPDYIRFYNTLWLIVNDISFGLIISAFLKDNHNIVVDKLSQVIPETLYYTMGNITKFLADNPFGIKLNNELASFLAELFLWIMEFSYNSLLKFTSDRSKLSIFIWVVTKACSILGLSFGISLLIDFFSLLSFHIYLFYHISSKLYHWQANAIVSLFYLFCGKKKNVLRKRIDYDFFELDELLLGTLLFIILIFLMPTVLSFYTCYSVLWMVTIYFHILLNSCIGLINHFPLFAFLLRTKDSRRLPGGILIALKRHKTGRSVFYLKNNALPISMMFKPFLFSMDRIKGYYFSTSTFKSLLNGLPISVRKNELYDELYAYLPEHPVDIFSIKSKLQGILPTNV